MGYYWYDTQLELDGRHRSLIVLYKHRDGPYAPSLDEVIDKVANRRLAPNQIVVVTPQYLADEIRSEFMDISGSTKERLRSTQSVLVLPYDCGGQLTKPEELLSKGLKDWIPTDDDLLKISLAGMEIMVRESGTVLRAPPGYYFKKPSQHLNAEFIRTGNMLRDTGALSLIHHLCLRTIPPKTQELYIDSFTILPIALYYRAECAKLQETCVGLFPEPTIVNFHSYDMDDTFRFPGHENYFVLISASSSGSLAKKLVEKHGAKSERIKHVLIFSDNETLRKETIYFQRIPSPKPLRPTLLKEISIPGEEFMAAHGDSKAVKLAADQFSEMEKRIFKDQFYQDSLELRLGGAYTEQSPVGLRFEKGGFLNTPHFGEWLRNELSFEVPTNVHSVLAVGGEHCLRLAEEVTRRLAAHLKLPQVLFEQGDDWTETLAKLESAGEGSVLIVCDQESQGQSLLEISRRLRPFKGLHRHYLLGHLLPESLDSFNRLRKNLVMSGQGRNYGLSVYSVTPIGVQRLHSSWLEERQMLRPIKLEQSQWPQNLVALIQALKLRAASLESGTLNKDGLFLPTFDGKALSLQPDAVLLDPGYKNISQVTVYLLISVALQRGRDRKHANESPLPDDQCFGSNPFIDTVIDPDTFSRFNDGIIQAAILRAASQDELNYSRSGLLSQHMTAIIAGMLRGRRNRNGEAALEMLYAFLTKKIRLAAEGEAAVQKQIESDTELTHFVEMFRKTEEL